MSVCVCFVGTIPLHMRNALAEVCFNRAIVAHCPRPMSRADAARGSTCNRYSCQLTSASLQTSKCHALWSLTSPGRPASRLALRSVGPSWFPRSVREIRSPRTQRIRPGSETRGPTLLARSLSPERDPAAARRDEHAVKLVLCGVVHERFPGAWTAPTCWAAALPRVSQWVFPSPICG